MPCRSYEDDHPPAPVLKHHKTYKFLEELHKRVPEYTSLVPVPEINFQTVATRFVRPTPFYNIDEVAAALCAVLKFMEKAHVDMSFLKEISTDNLATWWEQHKAADEAERQNKIRKLATLREQMAQLEREIKS